MNPIESLPYNYPSWTCSKCAMAHDGKWLERHLASFHMGICDICNEWKSLAQPSDYQYPRFTKKRDWNKIHTELSSVMCQFAENDQFAEALLVLILIDDMMYECIESEKDGRAITTISRKQRRSLGTGNENVKRAIREGP